MSETGLAGSPFYVGEQLCCSDDILTVRSPYDGREVGAVCRGGEEHMEAAIARAVEVFPTMRKLSSLQRSTILENAERLLRERGDEFARGISAEAGKPMRDARAEVSRALLTFHTAAAEAVRINGEWMPLDVLEATAGQWALIRHFPLGPIGAISPFNFPLNLVVHKLAPAIAAGNTVVLKPASATPQTALRLCKLLYEAGLPAGALSVIPCSPRVGEKLATDERLRMLTFTGSPVVGWRLKSLAGAKRVTLELGGNAGVIIHQDADVETAARRCAFGAFYYAGQSCISVQRIFVHESIHEAFVNRFVALVKALKTGDPALDDTDVGPMIQESEAARAEAWIREAVAGGARLLTGGKRAGAVLQPTVLADTRPEMKVNCQEIFAPVATVTPYSDVFQALEALDDSAYGLQAGLFTRDMGLVFEAYERLHVGGLVVNEIPSHRVDPMPYGGTKDSGTGREGVRWAIREMCEEKTLVYKPLPV